MSGVLPKNSVREILRHLGNRLLTGIFVSVPLVVTIWVLTLAYRFITSISSPFWQALGVGNIPLLGFGTTLLLLIGLGFMATHVIGRRILEAVEAVIGRLPLVSQIYNAIKQAIDSFKQMNSNPPFKRVAYVEYPSEGCFLLGFVTGQFRDNKNARDLTLVFLPTAPNPLTGFIVAIPDEKVIDSDLTLEQATKMIITAGLVVPIPGAPPPGGNSCVS